MNPTFHAVREVNLLPSDLGGSKDRGTGLYCLEATYKPQNHPRALPLVWVPKTLLPYFQEGLVGGFHLETLPFNSRASQSLPGSPLHAVIGVRLLDGSEHVEVPGQWQGVRKRLLWLSAAGLLAAFITLIASTGWLGRFAGAALGVYGAFRLVEAFSVWPKPFCVGLVHGHRDPPVGQANFAAGADLTRGRD